MKSLMVSTDEASDKAIAAWNNLNRICKLGERFANDHRHSSVFTVDGNGKFVWDGPSAKVRLQKLLL